MSSLKNYCEAVQTAAELFVCTHNKSSRIDQTTAPVTEQATLKINKATISAKTQITVSPCGGQELNIQYAVEEGHLLEASVGIQFDFAKWSTDNYVLMPAAVYNGNRYPRKPEENAFKRADAKHHDVITVTHTPRLYPEGEPADGTKPNQWLQCYPGGPSRIQLLTGDCSTPLMGIHFPALKQAIIISTDQTTALGNTSMSILESSDKNRATVTFKAPGVREETTYSGLPSNDRGDTLNKGDIVEIRIVLHVFSAPDIPALFDKFFTVRNELRGNARIRHDLPFSAAWAMQERKYNQQNWVEKEGYYSVGMRESPNQDWQTGWVGGPNCAYALLMEGDGLTWERAQRTFDFIAREARFPSGFIKSTYGSGLWYSTEDAYLRYSADTLYFFIKALFLLQKKPPFQKIKQSWVDCIRGVCDAFVTLYNKEGRFVHFVNPITGDTLLGGSCAAGLAPAGLAMAARFFKEPKYLEVAEGAARVYLNDFVNKGITNGGPGDIHQGIDSESAAGICDSFAVLYEETNKQEWLDAGIKIVHLCASWTTSYDYIFPPNSTFGKLDMLTTGTVWANIQNKHSAPGICTLSGDSLFKLYRASGDKRVLDMIREIAHTIPQYLSRADRPIADIRPTDCPWNPMPEGWMNERINMSDWELRNDSNTQLGVGEVFAGSCWSEGSMLLTYAELPGIYLHTDTLFLSVFDHVFCQIAKVAPSTITLMVTNPTRFNASVKILAEKSTDLSKPLGVVAFAIPKRVYVSAGDTTVIEIER